MRYVEDAFRRTSNGADAVRGALLLFGWHNRAMSVKSERAKTGRVGPGLLRHGTG